MSYTFFMWNENNYAYVEAYLAPNQPVHTLKIPMEELYHAEVSYILDSEVWSDEDENFEHYKEMEWNEFSAGATPKLVSWWLATLPYTNRKNRRKTWIPKNKKELFWNWLKSLTVLLRTNEN